MYQRLTQLSLVIIATLAMLWHSTLSAQSSTQDKLIRAVPDECLFVSIWNQATPIPPGSTNKTDQLLSEPTVRQFIDSVFPVMQLFIQEGMRGIELPLELRRDVESLMQAEMNVMLRGEGAVIVKDLEITETGPRQLEAVALLYFGESAPRWAVALQRLLAAEVSAAKTVTLGEVEFKQFTTGPDSEFSILVGHVDGQLVVGVGEEFVASTLNRLSGNDVADWVEQFQKRVPLERRTLLNYVNLASVQKKLMATAPAEVKALIDSLGLENIAAIETTSGYVDSGMATQTLLRFDGEPKGIFALGSSGGLAVSDLTHIPDDSMFALAVSTDLSKQFDFFLERLRQLSPRDADSLEQGMIEFRREVAVNPQADLIDQIGPTITLHNAAGDGLLSGMILTAELQDEERFANALLRMMDLYNRSEHSTYEPTLVTKRVGDAMVSTIVAPGSEAAYFPFEISFCVHKKRLLVSLYPQTIVSFLTQQVEPLFASELPKSAFVGKPEDSKLFALGWLDTRRPFELMYPFAQMGMTMLRQPDNTPRDVRGLMQSINLPPARAIYRHLEPSVLTMRRVADGIELESRQTLLVLDPLFVAPFGVGLLLPAVQQVQVAAARTESANRVRQLVLAMHNHLSDFRTFPSGFGPRDPRQVNAPAVSWRVKLLPYLDERQLYDMYNMDEPWDSENNLKVLKLMPDCFRSPRSQAGPYETTFLAIGGERGVLGKDREGRSTATRIESIVDGTSNTVIVVDAGDQLAVPWTKPDEGIDPANFSIFDLSGQFSGGFNAGFADGSIRFIRLTLEPDVLRSLFEMNDGGLLSPGEIED